ncbi:unnamed protein product [Trichogramma brassicae]|uniref:Uncharacterized protein n=1 Tax=Trichogramma brassicae TaxID=86971 RepID=A0A6H5IMJ2_9HYME|nr:unnamed protein product [Trichogramma brassicae]
MEIIWVIIVPVQPATGQSDRFVQTCRLPLPPHRRLPSFTRGSTETSTPKRLACDYIKYTTHTYTRCTVTYSKSKLCVENCNLPEEICIKSTIDAVFMQIRLNTGCLDTEYMISFNFIVLACNTCGGIAHVNTRSGLRLATSQASQLSRRLGASYSLDNNNNKWAHAETPLRCVYILSCSRIDRREQAYIANLYYAQLQWCGRNRVVGRPDPEEEEEEEEIEEITQTDIQYIQENLNADSGPVRISQNMSDPNDNAPNQPSTEQEQVPARRPGRPRTNASVAPSVNVEENEAADGQEQVPARRRGRPRTNASVASSVNVEQNEAAGEQQQVPVRRRGRPRTNAPAASSVNQEQNEAAGEQAPVPTRRRGRPRTNASAASAEV